MPGQQEQSPGTGSLDSDLPRKGSTRKKNRQATNLRHDMATWVESEAGSAPFPCQGHLGPPDERSTLLPYMEMAVGLLFVCHLLRKSRADFLARGQVLLLPWAVSPVLRLPSPAFWFFSRTKPV